MPKSGGSLEGQDVQIYVWADAEVSKRKKISALFGELMEIVSCQLLPVPGHYNSSVCIASWAAISKETG